MHLSYLLPLANVHGTAEQQGDEEHPRRRPVHEQGTVLGVWGKKSRPENSDRTQLFSQDGAESEVGLV